MCNQYIISSWHPKNHTKNTSLFMFPDDQLSSCYWRSDWETDENSLSNEYESRFIHFLELFQLRESVSTT